MSEKKAGKRIDALTSIRLFWAFSVFITHFVVVYADSIENQFIKINLQFGNFGVSCFFISSGYLIAKHYLATEMKNGFAFALPKIKKIYLLHILSFIPWLAVYAFDCIKARSLVDGLKLTLRLLLNITLTQSWIPFHEYSLNNVSWFLSILFFLYIITPYMLKFLSKLAEKTLVIVVLLVASLAILFVIDYFYGDLEQLYPSWILRFFQYFAGSLTFIAGEKIKAKPGRLFTGIVVILHLAVYVFCHLVIVATLSAMVVMWCLDNYEGKSFLNNKVLVWLGLISSEFFLMHNVVLSFGKHVLCRFYAPTGVAALIIHFIVILLSTILCCYLYKLFVSKVLKNKKQV